VAGVVLKTTRANLKSSSHKFEISHDNIILDEAGNNNIHRVENFDKLLPALILLDCTYKEKYLKPQKDNI
jgi:hypothetical protein